VIALRHAEPVVSHGDFTMLLPDDPHVYAFTRALAGSRGDASDGAELLDREMLVLGNFSGEERDVELKDGTWAGAELVLGNYASDDHPSDGGAAAAGPLRLRPWELKVLRRSRRA
jgi:oligo-1,6-glucosidase